MTLAVPALFGESRLQMDESLALTVDSLQAYGPRHRHWAVAWSGGKDSTTLLTLLVYLLDSGRVAHPETFTVLQADTRLEILPLWLAAREIRQELRDRGIDVRVVLPPLDKRFLVYILGRGVPPPNNNTLRWCTRQTKVDPMQHELERLAAERGTGRLVSRSGDGAGWKFEPFPGEKILTLTGVRQGESAVRDGRIAMSCGVNGGECGQGWYQETLPESLCDTLAPMLHWRVCHVWAWLRHWAPQPEFGDWSTELLAEAYGGDEAEEVNARTGCICCPLASRDTALDNLIAAPRWSYLAPLKKLRTVWADLRLPRNRLRKHGETLKSGAPSSSPYRMGPLTLECREEALGRVLAIQAEVNALAAASNRPAVDLLNDEEEARIRELIAAGTWPDRWDGSEPLATEPYEEPGQPSLFRMLEGALA